MVETIDRILETRLAVFLINFLAFGQSKIRCIIETGTYQHIQPGKTYSFGFLIQTKLTLFIEAPFQSIFKHTQHVQRIQTMKQYSVTQQYKQFNFSSISNCYFAICWSLISHCTPPMYGTGTDRKSIEICNFLVGVL